ncbi:hypothetical protein K9M74_01040 [Candidatus Woesearchaeota archaeon]|nr:hypothetical protein [Candidatus Woesearchaeota archaeon]
MLVPFRLLPNDDSFPLDAIVAMLDWKHELYKSDEAFMKQHDHRRCDVIPVFSLDDALYVPKRLGVSEKPPYSGMKISTQDLFMDLSPAKLTTMPRSVVSADTFLYGLIPWIPEAKDVFREKENLTHKDVKEMVECGVELSKQHVFHLDLNFGNVVKADRIYFVDPSIATPHVRPEHDYFNERMIQYHWAPEVLRGGFVSEKSSVFSLAKTIKFCYKSMDVKLDRLLGACSAQNPAYRPSFTELASEVDRL